VPGTQQSVGGASQEQALGYGVEVYCWPAAADQRNRCRTAPEADSEVHAYCVESAHGQIALTLTTLIAPRSSSTNRKPPMDGEMNGEACDAEGMIALVLIVPHAKTCGDFAGGYVCGPSRHIGSSDSKAAAQNPERQIATLTTNVSYRARRKSGDCFGSDGYRGQVFERKNFGTLEPGLFRIHQLWNWSAPGPCRFWRPWPAIRTAAYLHATCS